jgi:hypothetical protein
LHDIFEILTFSVDLRVEWLKCRARAARWKEEVCLLEEEMRRCSESTSWKAAWWLKQADVRRAAGLSDPFLLEGLRAYAAEQSATEQLRVIRYGQTWGAIRARAALVRESFLGKAEESPIALPELEIELEDDEDEGYGSLEDADCEDD